MKYIKLFEQFISDINEADKKELYDKAKQFKMELANLKKSGGSEAAIAAKEEQIKRTAKALMIARSKPYEGLEVAEALKTKTPNEVITIDLDMGWDDSNPEEDKAAKAAFKKYKIKVEPASHSDQEGTFEVTGKKKDILAYLQSEFYEMDADTIEEYYPELLEGTLDEADVDPAIAKQLDYFYEMQNKIKEYEKEIEAMKDEFKQFADELKPMMDGMKEVGEKLAKTEDFIIAISRFGGERKDASYKNAFENALTKVNAATKKVLEEALEASKKVTNVKHSFNIQKVEEASIFTKITDMLKKAVSKFVGIFKKETKTIDDANKELAKLAK
jgi:hypothetical protein